MSKVNVAVIDLGSNSFRLQISEVKDSIYKVISEYKETVRIGDTVYTEGKFTQDNIDTVVSTLKSMQKLMEQTPIDAIRVVGTAPFRDASNSEEVIRIAKAETGLDIEVISGDEEASLSFLAATGYFELSDSNVIFVDVGGGSTEISFVVSGDLVESISTDLGCLRLTRQFVKKNKAKPSEVESMREHINKIINDLSLKIDSVLGNPITMQKIVFTGGTVNNLAQVHAKRSSMEDSVVKYVDATFLRHFINELAGKSYEARGKIPGLEVERADISLAAALIVAAFLEKYNLQGFYTFSGGFRNGVTIDLLNKIGIKLFFQNNTNYSIRYVKLVETGRKYNFEEQHALHVTMLCEKLFSQLRKVMCLKRKYWKILEAASILHDVGQHISYSDHHKHSYYLIKNTELVGYSEYERDLVANVARYHRRSLPKLKHPQYAELSNDDKYLVDSLAGILRIADGLDRTHMSVVEDVEVKVTDNYAKFYLTAKSDPSVEIVGFNKKKDLFEDVIDREVIIVE